MSLSPSPFRVAKLFLKAAPRTRYEFLLIEIATPPTQRLYTLSHGIPDRVYRWRLSSKPPPDVAPRPDQNCQIEDKGHDWTVYGSKFKYSGVGLAGDTWLILQYGDGTYLCHDCKKSLPDGSKFCAFCGALQGKVASEEQPSAARVAASAFKEKP